MLLSEGQMGKSYIVEELALPLRLEKRLESLGMTRGTEISVLGCKGRGIVIAKLRGTRFALGRNITKNITVRCSE